MTTVGTSRKCKNGWCESYLEYTKDFEAPELYHFWVSVSLIAATLEQNVMLDREKLGKLPANLYIILVGESAEDKKTTAIDIGEEFLREAVEDIPIAPESVSAQALGEELRDQSEKTGVGAGYILAEELSYFFGEKDFRGDLIKMLTKGFTRRKTMKVRRIGRGKIEVKNPCFNFLGGTTPDYVLALPIQAVSGGWAGRNILVYADEKRAPKADVSFNEGDHELRSNLIKDLAHIRTLRGEFVRSEAAVRLWTEWYEETRVEEGKQFSLKGYGSRRGNAVLKLAMVMSANRNDSLIIEESDISSAIGLLESTEASFPDVLTHGLQIAPVGKLPRIRQIIQRKQPVEWSPLLHESGLTSKELQDILADLIEQDDVVETQRAGRKGPVRIFSIKKFTMKGGGG